MQRVFNLAEDRPYLFVIGLFIVQSVLAIPFVVLFKVLGLDILPLRVILPIVESVFIIWVIWRLGWFERAGFTRNPINISVYWYPVILAFVPVLLYGTIKIEATWIAFYLASLLFTGLAEEGFARGVLIPALLVKGKWVALLFAAVLFSSGHFTNIFFEEFTALEWADKFLATFGFAVLYGALFLRTQAIWPLIILHAIHDYSYLTSGTAGPFVVEPMSMKVHIVLSIASIAYGIYVASLVATPEQEQSSSGARAPA